MCCLFFCQNDIHNFLSISHILLGDKLGFLKHIVLSHMIMNRKKLDLLLYGPGSMSLI